jgi:hypothetical protein
LNSKATRPLSTRQIDLLCKCNEKNTRKANIGYQGECVWEGYIVHENKYLGAAKLIRINLFSKKN